jgi:hypothetical protein
LLKEKSQNKRHGFPITSHYSSVQLTNAEKPS